MADHAHDAEVAAFGECTTCIRRRAAQAEAARDRAVATAASGAPDVWMTRARQVVRQLADTGADFTTDALWARLPQPPEPRAMGAVMTWAAEQGLVVATDRTEPSTRPECHARPVRVWAPARARLL